MVIGVTMVKDEADIIERTIRHMAYECDLLVVWDNESEDGTREILRDLDGEIYVRDDPEVGYYQSRKMSEHADYARREFGAEWVIPFDADERWRPADRRDRIADQLMRYPDEALVVEASVVDHVATGDPEMPWRREEQLPLRKVACRAVEGLVIHAGNHGATFPGVDAPLTITGRLEVRHFPYRSPEQFIRKARNGAAAYAATDLPEDVGAHWRGYGELTDEELRAVFHRWFWSDDPAADPNLVHDPCTTPRAAYVG